MTSPDDAKTRAAWDRFVAGGGLARDQLREHVYRAWQRCVAQGVNPRAMTPSALSPVERDDLLSRERDLLDAARPYMRALSRAAGEDPHAAMLGDRDGVVLDVVGPDGHAAVPGLPGPGTLLSEACAGANGIGTPLAEGAYVDLVGPEHFIEGFHAYTCQGLPLRAGDGATVGVLGLAVLRIQTAQRIREVLICAANGIAAELVARRLRREASELCASGAASGPLLERLRQDIVQLQATARLKLEKAARLAPEQGPEEVTALLLASNQLAAEFARSSVRWRELASDEPGSLLPVDLSARVGELRGLLATELAIRGIELALDAGEPILVIADPSELGRAVLRALLQALEAADRSGPRSGPIAVRVERRGERGAVLVGGEPLVSYPLTS